MFKKKIGIMLLIVVVSLIFMSCRESAAPETSCFHVWDWVVTTAPTATKAGEETRTCLLCGETGINRPVPATPAVINSVTININAPVNGGTPVTTAVTNNTGWNTISSAVGSVGMGTNYNANSSFTPNGNITLYANLGGFLLAVTSFVKNPLYFIENI